MPHCIHKCTNTLYDYDIIINTYVSLMYELKKNGKVFTSKFVGTGPSSYKKNLPAAVSQRFRNTVLYYSNLMSVLRCFLLSPPDKCLKLGPGHFFPPIFKFNVYYNPHI